MRGCGDSTGLRVGLRTACWPVPPMKAQATSPECLGRGGMVQQPHTERGTACALPAPSFLRRVCECVELSSIEGLYSRLRSCSGCEAYRQNEL